MFDRERLEETLAGDYGYYSGPAPHEEIDNRLHPTTADLIRSSLRPDLDVLDIGCGSGTNLLAHAAQMRTGVGIDQRQSSGRRASRTSRSSNSSSAGSEVAVGTSGST